MATVINRVHFKKPKNRKNKVELVFDEEKRRDFLCGFRKRKLDRKRKAQEKLAQELKEERKRLKKEARESYKKLVVSHRTIPELDNLFSKEYEEGEVTVKVTELSTSEIANKNNWIGENKPIYDAEDSEQDEEIKVSDEENISGMELKPKVKKEIEKEKPKKEFKTKKEVKTALRKEATKKVQKSRAFQIKNKIEQQKNRRKSIKKQKQQELLKGKKQKHKKGRK